MSYLKNVEQKQRSENPEGRAMGVAIPARLQTIVADHRRQDHPRDSRSGSHSINNITTPASGNNQWRNECTACGFSNKLTNCCYVSTAKKQILLERSQSSTGKDKKVGCEDCCANPYHVTRCVC